MKGGRERVRGGRKRYRRKDRGCEGEGADTSSTTV